MLSKEAKGFLLLASVLVNCALVIVMALWPKYDSFDDGISVLADDQSWIRVYPWKVQNNTGKYIVATVSDDPYGDILCPDQQIRTLSWAMPEKDNPEVKLRAYEYVPITKSIECDRTDRFGGLQESIKLDSTLISCKVYSLKDLPARPSITIEPKLECP